MRETFPIPTFEELSDDMVNSTIFSELDLNMAFHQIVLDPESRKYTTFSTPLGLMRCIRLPMGFSSSSEILQRTLASVLAGLPGVKHVHDNIFIHGSDLEEHNTRLKLCLQRLQENGVTLNRSKCKFAQSKLDFMSMLYTCHGIQPTPKHVEAIKEFPEPATISEVRSFLGLANFLRRFVPNMATISAPLRQLTCKNEVFKWTDLEKKSFNLIKSAISSETVLSFFDRSRKTHVWVDASPIGIGAILSQSDVKGDIHPISFASRSLSLTEQRYAQIEREALAVKYGCLKFRHYLLGDPGFVIHTDHRPLLQLMHAHSKPPPRIERMVLAIQDFAYTLVHTPGDRNPADILSRKPLPMPSSSNVGEIQDSLYCNAILEAARPIALTLNEIRSATAADATLLSVASSIRSGSWQSKDPAIKSYYALRDSLTEVDGIIMRDDKIVVPSILRQRILQLAHQGHQGINRTTDRLFTKVWWPKMTSDASLFVQSCMTCQSLTPPKSGIIIMHSSTL